MVWNLAQSRREGEASPRIMKRKLPTAVELAQIAACLPVTWGDKERLDKALRLYFASEETLADLIKRMANSDDLLTEYRSEESILNHLLPPLYAEDEKNILPLKMWVTDSSKCPVREFLGEYGLVVKTASTVLKYIRKFREEDAEELIEKAKRETDKGIVYDLPPRLLEVIISAKRKQKSKAVSKRYKTRQNKKTGKKKPVGVRSKKK